MTAHLADRPCGSCPYRRDVPSGVWAPHEYEKLAAYDGETGDQPIAAFFCHRQDGNLCAGWVGCHDMENSMGLRFALLQGTIDGEDFGAALDFVSPVPLFGTGAAAAEHGLAEVGSPGPAAQAIMAKMRRTP